MSGFEIVRGPSQPEGIKCLTCGNTSYHPEDVRQKYCGFCHKFLDDLPLWFGK